MCSRWLVLVAGLSFALSSCKRDPKRIPSLDGGPDVPSADRVTPIDSPDGTSGDAVDSQDGASPGPDVPIDPGCPAGQHLCAGTCVENTDPRTCGTACTPCEPVPDGTETCNGVRCGASCPAGKKLCSGACIDMSATCAGCQAGTHDCAGQCPSATSVNACGASCDPCPVPPGASQATCDGTKCDFQCMSGYHKCGTGCARDNDAAQCGTTCLACPGITNGVAQCLSGTCGLVCNAGFHLCNGMCVSDTSALSCGTSCDPCPVPLSGGTATCTAGMCGGSCPTGKKLCKGTCVDMVAACDAPCPTGTHNCSEICVSNMSVNNCGATACTACPRPTGASDVTCNGTICDFTCGAGYHRCGTGATASCARDDDATQCGMTCTSCPTDPNGAAACQGGMCVLVCKTGYHLCGTRCVSNMDVANCGQTACTACTPTTAGNVTCDGLACVRSCPTAGTKLCGDACIANANACMGQCMTPGTHNCSGVCQPNDNVNSCVDRCSPCPATTNGVATCGAAGCGIMCNTGFHNCSGACVANNSPATCGTGATSCAPCVPPANATATCNGTTCGFTCNNGFHLCNGACVSNMSTNSCGTSCTACAAAPANGTVTCNGTTCDFTCTAPGYHRCSSACYSDSSTTQCGSNCVNCTQPNANPACVAGACANSCIGGAANTLSCAGTGGKPNCSLWDFESNTAEGWAFDVATAMGTGSDAHVGVVGASATQGAVGTTHSMAFGFNGPSQATWVVYVKVPLCANGQALNLTNKTLSFNVKMVTGPGSPPLLSQANLVRVFTGPTSGLDGGDFSVDPATGGGPTAGSWQNVTVDLTGQFGTGANSITHLGFRFLLSYQWSGTIYLDYINLY